MNMEKNIVAEEVNAEFLKGFIYCVRGVRVMLDMDLAKIYGYSTKDFNRQVKNNEFGEFSIEDMPPFSFASGVNAWCNCQDIPYNEPNPWDYVEVEVLVWQANRVKLNWKWGNLPSVVGVGLREFRYGFVVVKEDGEWKIASLAGFSL